MDFKQLEAFVCVADLGNFSKAAEKLHLTQPTISTHIQSLEYELNAQLIVRSPKNAYPTKVGKQLYDYAANMLLLRENAIAACINKGDKVSGTILIAASTIPYQYLLPTHLAAFHKQHPDITFKLSRYDSAGVVDSLLAGKVELGLTGAAITNQYLVYQEICRDDLVVITPPTPFYTARSESTLSLEEIRQSPFVVREPGSGTRMEAEELLKAKGIILSKLNIVTQMDNPEAINNAVSKGLGISIVSKLSVENLETLGRVKVFQLEGESFSRNLYFVHHKCRQISTAANQFQRFVLRREK